MSPILITVPRDPTATTRRPHRGLTQLTGHARKAGRGPRRRTGRSAASRERSDGIRAWARAHGIAVSDRGRIPASVAEQDQAAGKDA